MSNLPWFVAVFILLFIVWIFNLGSESPAVWNPFINPPAPLGEGGTYGTFNINGSANGENNAGGTTQGAQNLSPSQSDTATGVSAVPKDPLFAGKIALRSRSADSMSPDTEVLEIIASQNNTQPLIVSGWKLKSAVSGKEVLIGNGALLPYTGQVNTEQIISLNPGDHAYVISGRSPIGVSFRLNACSGYFEQFQDYVPELSSDCPHPLESAPLTTSGGYSNPCLDYIESIPRCFTHVQAVPLSLGDLCSDFITQKFNYASCVGTYKNNPNFYKPEWRIYLKQNAELWKDKRETIYLLSESGQLIDAVSY